MSIEVFRTVREIRDNNIYQTIFESHKPGWSRYNDSNWFNYNNTFEPLLNEFYGSIFEVVDSFKERPHKTSVNGLDIFGSGSALEGLGFQKGLGVALDYYDNAKREQRKLNGIDFIPGDVIDPSTWENIFNWTNSNGLFSVILCRPGGPFIFHLDNPTLPNWPLFYYHLLRKTYRILNQDGILLSEVPFCCRAFLPRMKGQLGDYFTLTYSKNGSIIMLKKIKSVGTELPKSLLLE